MDINFRRLSWAGIEIRSGSWHLLVDPLEATAPLEPFLGRPRWSLAPVEVSATTWVLTTHLHRDHFDSTVLRRVHSGQTLCHRPIASTLEAEGIGVEAIDLWDPYEIGPFRVTAVPSADWRGDDQVAWLIESADVIAIHCGDTIWHGGWYEIAARFGPIQIAFLPINGVLADLSGFTRTDVPATLTPEQAVEASRILQAEAACAIHHSLFNNPPRYTEQPNAVARFMAAGKRRGVTTVAPDDGDIVLSVSKVDRRPFGVPNLGPPPS